MSDQAQHGGRPRGVTEILNSATEQVLGVLAAPFFDGEGWHEASPVVKAGVAEAGTAHITARHIDPPYRADITLDVRTDFDSPDDVRYHVRGHCEISRGNAGATQQVEFTFGAAIASNGLLDIDAARLGAELASAIRSLA